MNPTCSITIRDKTLQKIADKPLQSFWRIVLHTYFQLLGWMASSNSMIDFCSHLRADSCHSEESTNRLG